MRIILLVAVLLGLAQAPPGARGQAKKSEEEFAKEKPTLGDEIPARTVYAPDGKEVKTSSLRGHYTVLTFGCLT